MNYKILSLSKYKDNIEILINYKQLKFYYLQANRKYKHCMVHQVKITLYGPPNITLEIIFLKFPSKFCMINQAHIKYSLQANRNI